MSTKKKTVALTDTVALTLPKIDLTDDRTFEESRTRSGNPKLKSTVGTRLHANTSVNGSSVIFLAILGAIDGIRKGKIKIVDSAIAREALALTRKADYKTPAWERVAKVYPSLGRSKNMKSKIGVVYNPIVNDIESGNLKGIDIENIASTEFRAQIFAE